MSSSSTTEHKTVMKCASSTNKDESRHKNADTSLSWSFHMRNYLHKSETSILSSNEIRNCIQSVSLTSVWQERWTVEQKMQTKNTSKSNSVSYSRSIQKSKHWNSRDRIIHKLATCLSEHATEQDHATQLSQQLNAKN